MKTTSATNTKSRLALPPVLARSRRHESHGREERPHPARVAGEQRQVRDVGERPDEKSGRGRAFLPPAWRYFSNALPA